MLYLRVADLGDMDLLYSWANDEETRRQSFHREPIPYQCHQKWFQNILSSPSEIQYILMDGTQAVGQARLSFFGDTAEISYSINPVKRNSGYGTELLHLLKQKTKEDLPGIKKLIGKVKPENVASFYCFMKNGFREQYQLLEYDMDNQNAK